MSIQSGPDADSGETKALLLVAEAIQSQTAAGRSTYSLHNTLLLWFLGISILCHVTQIVVTILVLPSLIAKGIDVNQHQNVTVNGDGEGSYEKRIEEKRLQRLVKHD